MVKEIIIPKENKAQIEEVRELENKDLEQQRKEDEKVAESYEAEFEAIDANPDFGPGQSQSSDEVAEKVAEGVLGVGLAAGSIFPPTAPVVAPTAAVAGIGGEVVDKVTSDNPTSDGEEVAKRVGKGLALSGGIGSIPTGFKEGGKLAKKL
jgi:hypothetical protein